MPVELHGSGGASITGNAVLGYRGVVVLHAIKLYLSTNGRVLPTRGVGPKQMRAIASEYTGRAYARSRKGLELALADMEALSAGKSLDQLGEVRAVNAEVGGVAADLSAERGE